MLYDDLKFNLGISVELYQTIELLDNFYTISDIQNRYKEAGIKMNYHTIRYRLKALQKKGYVTAVRDILDDRILWYGRTEEVSKIIAYAKMRQKSQQRKKSHLNIEL